MRGKRARINNINYIWCGRRKTNFRKCVVCKKALVPRNKTNLCSICWSKEATLNANNQKIYKYPKVNK